MENQQINQQILKSATIFNRALHKAESALKKNNLNSALAWAEIGAHFAFVRHPGFYTSAPLEKLLLQIAQKIDVQPNHPLANLLESQTKNHDKTRFLHVLTEAYESGGHSRFITRWIRNTSENSIHSLITTSGNGILPVSLSSAIEDSGGWHNSLSEMSSSLVERSLLLRQLAKSWADIIVLFTHPFDPLPTAAFGIEGGPPIIFCNHADHVFWLGVSISDVIAEYHVTGSLLSAKRRGIVDSKLLPIPLAKAAMKFRDDATRGKLGLKNDELLLLTVGRDEKFLPFDNIDFLDVMVKIVKKHPKLKLIAVGPEDAGRWKEASDIVEGKIKAVGTLDRGILDMLYYAADLYVESFPCGSGTALLEAGMHAVPVIGLHLEQIPHISGEDDVSFENLKVHTYSVSDLIKSLEYMIEYPDASRQKALLIKENIENFHCQPGWNWYLDKVIKALPDHHQIRTCKSIDAQTDYADIYLAYVDSEKLSNELLEHSFSRLIRVYSKYLKRSETVQEQTKYFLNALPKVRNSQKAREYLYNFREFINSAFARQKATKSNSKTKRGKKLEFRKYC